MYEIVEVGAARDIASRTYDFLYAFIILLNLGVCIANTFDAAEAVCGPLLQGIEDATGFLFIADYVLRILSAPDKYTALDNGKARWKYLLSFMGIIDLISFLPYCMPFFLPSGIVAFRLFRFIRIFRLFRINAYYDSLNVITTVLKSKRQQLLSAVFIILVLMVFSSMCMYSIENEAQPDVFRNAFSGVWWAVSTLLTVGYGDIYPITPTGKLFGIIITFLGVGVVAIPTGIISAGFVSQYNQVKRMSDYGKEESIHFIRMPVAADDKYVGRKVMELHLPKSVLVAAIHRNGKVLVPKGETTIREGDTLIVGAEAAGEDHLIELKEITLTAHNPWTGKTIRELDISRKTLIGLIRREEKSIIPSGGTQLLEGDVLVMYSQAYIPDAEVYKI